jgi:hypothetical protein
MSDGATASDRVSPDVVDDARVAAAGTRNASRWLASALGAIPSLAVVGTVIAAPGDAGWDAPKLWVGVLLAAAGASLGVLAFARVIAPVPLEDSKVKVDITRLPGHSFATFQNLREDAERVRQAAAQQAHDAASAEVTAKRAEAMAAEREAIALAAKTASEAKPNDAELEARAREARSAADESRNTAIEHRAEAAAEDAEKANWIGQLAERDQLRQWAYGLQASETVGKRFLEARIAAVFAVALVAVGIVLVALAPKPKQASNALSLVTLSLNETGKSTIGCGADSVQALKIGGTDAAPEVITFPSRGCTAKTLTFTTEKPPLGSVKADEAVTPGG